MSPVSSKPVSARVLDAAIAWLLSLGSGDGSAVEQEEFAK
ncbi:amino acid ABC transporter substrate-binding protein, partial [Pseudomonas sp. K5002]|nr:amino acid ABC transporter substrate-binding protein [Pseudomonas sp. K5002]